MRVLVSYDISCEKRRAKALRKLRSMALLYQNSVFELRCSKTELAQLCVELGDVINEHEDKLICVPLTQSCSRHQLGTGITPIENQFFVLG